MMVIWPLEKGHCAARSRMRGHDPRRSNGRAKVLPFIFHPESQNTPFGRLSFSNASADRQTRWPRRRGTGLGKTQMYFTRQTEIALAILAMCARKRGCYVTVEEMVADGVTSAGSATRIVATLVRNGLLCNGYNGSVQLAVDPQHVTLAALLNITQPTLARSAGGRKRGKPTATVFNLVVEAASSNFLRLAERYTVADFLAERGAPPHSAVRRRTASFAGGACPQAQDCRTS